MSTIEGKPLGASELDAARRAAIKDLAFRFRSALSADERENYAAEAIVNTLEAHAAGTSIENLTQYVKSAARNAAINDGRRPERQNRSLDAALGLGDRGLGPAEQLELQNELAAAIDALREFPAEDQALFRAKKLEGKKLGEIVRATKRPRRTVSRRVKQMESAVAAAALDLTDPQRRLLWDFANGGARGSRRIRAQWLVQQSTDAANLVARYRHLNDGVAAALPAPALLDRASDLSIADRVASIPGRIRDHILGGGEPSALAGGAEPATAIAQSGAGRAGSAAAGGVLAKLGIGGAIGAKGIAACIGGGAAAAACVAAGVIPGVGLGGGERPNEDRPPPSERPVRPPEATDDLPAPNPGLIEPVETPSPEGPPVAGGETAQSRLPTQPAAPAPAPDQTVAGESPVVEEFEPVGTPAGSSSAPLSGSGSGAGSAADTGAGDFGP